MKTIPFIMLVAGFSLFIGIGEAQAPAVAGVGASLDVETIDEQQIKSSLLWSAKFLCGEIGPATPAGPAQQGNLTEVVLTLPPPMG